MFCQTRVLKIFLSISCPLVCMLNSICFLLLSSQKIQRPHILALASATRPKKANKMKMDKRILKKRKAKQPTETISWSVLPTDVETNILSRLPVTSLMHFRCVCKHWCSLLSDPHFIKMQLNRSTQMKEGSKLVFASCGAVFSLNVQAYGQQFYIKTRAQKKNHMRREQMVLPFRDQYFNKFLSISGSCNGILLLSASDYLYLLNPATKEYKKLPYPEILANKPYSSSIDILGFGYSPRTDEYKVMMIRCYTNERSAPSDVWVYTLGTNSSWRTIGHVRYNINRGINQWQHARVNGALHWMAIGRKESIVPISFDFGDEEFRELSLPKSFSKQDTVCPMGLVKFGGSLSLYHFNANGDFDIWTMMDYGDGQSWTKEFSVAQRILFRDQFQPPYIPLGFMNDDVVLFETGRGFFIINLFNLEILFLRLPVSVYGSEMYSESLVSLGNDGGVGGNKQERREKERERFAEDAKSNKLVKRSKKQR